MVLYKVWRDSRDPDQDVHEVFTVLEEVTFFGARWRRWKGLSVLWGGDSGVEMCTWNQTQLMNGDWELIEGIDAKR
jgi:hypothetical protein